MQPQEFFLPFVKKEQVAKDTYRFYFDRAKNPDWDFIAGQYIRLTFDIPNPDEKGKTRLFSAAASPLEKEHLCITTKISQSSFKQMLLTLIPGQEVKVFGPMGRFTLNESATNQHIFLVGGIGVTPLRSILPYAAEKKLQIPISVFISFSTPEEVVFYDLFTKIAADCPNIKVTYTITRPQESQAQWSGQTGRITEDLIKASVQEFSTADWYIVGPPAMVDAMLVVAKNLGAEDTKIHKEQFTGY